MDAPSRRPACGREVQTREERRKCRGSRPRLSGHPRQPPRHRLDPRAWAGRGREVSASSPRRRGRSQCVSPIRRRVVDPVHTAPSQKVHGQKKTLFHRQEERAHAPNGLGPPLRVDFPLDQASAPRTVRGPGVLSHIGHPLNPGKPVLPKHPLLSTRTGQWPVCIAGASLTEECMPLMPGRETSQDGISSCPADEPPHAQAGSTGASALTFLARVRWMSSLSSVMSTGLAM